MTRAAALSDRPRIGRRPLEFVDACLVAGGRPQLGGRATVDLASGGLERISGRSAGTVTYYLRQLELAGIVVRRRPMVVDLARYHAAGGAWSPTEDPATSEHTLVESVASVHELPTVVSAAAPEAEADSPASVNALLGQITELVGHVAALAAVVADLANGREVAANPVARIANLREGSGREEEVHRGEHQSSSLASRPPREASRPVPANDREHIDGLIERLLAHRRVDPRQLTARDPLRAALAGHPVEHREHAVDRLLADLDAGRGGFTNVFGCLHHKATTGDPDYFRSPPPPRATPAPPVEMPHPIDTEALDAVRAMTGHDRAELSEDVERRARSRPWFRESLFRRLRDDPATWELELADEWRRQRDSMAS